MTLEEYNAKTHERLRRFETVFYTLLLCVTLRYTIHGLESSGFWIDELFTVWVISGNGFAEFWDRALSDVHPPLYYLAIFFWGTVFGVGEVPLKAFSALCFSLAILAFTCFAPLRSSAKVFAAAFGSSSLYFQYQSQNARSYGLAILLISILLLLCYRIIDRKGKFSAREKTVLCAASLAASFAHPYGFFISLSALLVLMIFCSNMRAFLLSLVLLLTTTYIGYQILVVKRFTKFSLTNNWIESGIWWTNLQLREAWVWSFGLFGTIALLVLTFCAVQGLLSCRHRFDNAIFFKRNEIRLLLFSVLVPCLVTFGAIFTSVFAPNLTARNLLLVSPFLWGTLGSLYQCSFNNTNHHVTGRCLLGLLGFLSCALVFSKDSSRNEPFRRISQIISRSNSCSSERVFAINFDDPAWADNNFMRGFQSFSYSWYLGRPDPLPSVYLEDILHKSPSESTRRIVSDATRSSGCAVIAWSAHAVREELAEQVATGIASLSRTQVRDIRAIWVRVPALGLSSYPLVQRLGLAKERYRVGVIFIKLPSERLTERGEVE